MVEKLETDNSHSNENSKISKEDVDKLLKLNPLYNSKYEEINFAIICNKESLINEISSIIEDKEFINLLQKCLDEKVNCKKYQEKEYFQIVAKYVIPLTLLNPSSEFYKKSSIDFSNYVLHACDNENEEVRLSNILFFLFSFAVLSTTIFKFMIGGYSYYEKIIDLFSEYNDMNVIVKVFNYCLENLSKEIYDYYKKSVSEKQKSKFGKVNISTLNFYLCFQAKPNQINREDFNSGSDYDEEPIGLKHLFTKKKILYFEDKINWQKFSINENENLKIGEAVLNSNFEMTLEKDYQIIKQKDFERKQKRMKYPRQYNEQWNRMFLDRSSDSDNDCSKLKTRITRKLS